MSEQKLSVEDRLAINDLLMDYIWANDSGNLEGVVAAFTDDGIVQNGAGKRFKARDFATETLSHPGRKGRQHYMQQIAVRATATGCSVRSYWMVLQWLTSTGTKSFHAIGYYDDTCVKVEGRWRIKERRMYRCSDETPLPW